jgi:hypothetical protein
MLFTVASAEWSPGLPLRPGETRAGLFRTREAVGRIAAGRPTLAVALRYDPRRGTVIAQAPAARPPDRTWTAPAIADAAGGVKVLSPIPASLVCLVGPARLRLHQGHPSAVPPPVSGRQVGVEEGQAGLVGGEGSGGSVRRQEANPVAPSGSPGP